jgi:hypothetical protein
LDFDYDQGSGAATLIVMLKDDNSVVTIAGVALGTLAEPPFWGVGGFHTVPFYT